MNIPIISVTHLCKVFTVARRKGSGLQALFAREYKNISAVDQISFAIQPGELVGYLGPNGAGKSTTLKMLTGILVPSSGDVIVNGRVPVARAMARARSRSLRLRMAPECRSAF